jgi:hypothetical protein
MKSWRGNDLFNVLLEFLWQVSNSSFSKHANDVKFGPLLGHTHDAAVEVGKCLASNRRR